MSFATHNISVRYGRTPVLQDVSLSLPIGQITGLIGPNGVGKSTLLKAMAGLAPCTGEMTFDSSPLHVSSRRDMVAYMPQDSSAGSSLTLTEVVLLGRLATLGIRVSDDLIQAAQHLLADFGLAHLSHRTLDAVSGGQRQLTYLAQALFRQPRLLMLDEPTAALDLRHQLVVFETLQHLAKSKQIAVVVALHDLSLAAQFCDQVACLSNGQLDACGTAPQVLTADRLERVYGIQADVQHSTDNRLRITAIKAI
ncbi:ABC transporter ATP-binding protein [Roseovarius rhodophyticola]|uniref:ABC transporter ATP-binding protein n=1 Tax=Roseovarius rhodophyticola TaxID=3080827 RepID=A0ABZ2TH95_9RHOB|nr:ABC transporter ATP-binding protein [Roseovarius sp. W115]MDV2929324.1 ABC transporter ATP-binding protein [Roseovarius sp. W115]